MRQHHLPAVLVSRFARLVALPLRATARASVAGERH
jgi:hypothetical protein